MNEDLEKALEELYDAWHPQYTPPAPYDKYTLVQTCGACPEQYDLFDKASGKQVAYFRLRHGTFRVDVPDCGGETIHVAHPKGDGCFDDDEREKCLLEALAAVEYWITLNGRI